jgi:hypothetical protein
MTETATPPRRRWSYSLGAMLVAVTFCAILLGIARSTEELPRGIALAIGAGLFGRGAWLAHSTGKRGDAGSYLLGWIFIGIGGFATIFGALM